MLKLVRPLVAALLLLAAAGNGALAAGVVLTRPPAPRPLTEQRVFAASRPALVLVQSNYTVTVSRPQLTIPSVKVDLLAQQVVDLYRAGKVAGTEAALEQAAINLLLGNPGAYFEPGSRRIGDEYRLVGSGSGFFVTEDGYLVTAAHVVTAGKDDIRANILGLESDPRNQAELRAEVKQTIERDLGIEPSAAQLDKLLAFSLQFDDKYLAVDKVDVRYYLGSGKVEAGQHLTASGVRATVVATEPEYPGRDVAVLKVDVGRAPALALAATDPKPGQATYVLGYPRQGYLDEEVQMDATIPATLTGGTVRNAMDMPDGWTAYGTDADMTHGDSGGPVLDQSGRVLGIVSFGITDDKGRQLTGQGYFVPVSVIAQTLKKAQVRPAPGSLTATYYKALAAGDIHYYKPELAYLEQIQSRATFDAYVKDDLIAVEGSLLSGADQTPADLRPYLPAGVGAAFAALLLAVAAWVGLRLRTRQRTAGGASPALRPA